MPIAYRPLEVRRVVFGARLAYGISGGLPPLGPGFDSRTRRLVWVEFNVGFRLPVRVFLLPP